ncbi:MAG: korB, partial [Modestobacter sp.]|nr:korB [Modestobacter sp.]
HRTDPTYAFALSRLSSQDLRYTPMGVFRSVDKPVYDQMMADQLHDAATTTPTDFDTILAGTDSWTVPA